MNFVNLTSGNSATDAASYQTASITLAPGTIALIGIESDITTGDPGIPTVSGLGAGWFVVENCYYDQTGTKYRLTVLFSSPAGASSTGVVTIDFDETQTGCSWVIDQVTMSHTDRSAIPQSAKTSEPGSAATSVTASLAEETGDGNGFWACASWAANETGTLEESWTKLGQSSHANPVAAIVTGYTTNSDGQVVISWTTSAPKGAIILEILGVLPTELHAIQDDWNLRADADTERSEGMDFAFDYYLTDTAGNYLTDTAGNRLIARANVESFPQILHAIQDDWNLNSE